MGAMAQLYKTESQQRVIMLITSLLVFAVVVRISKQNQLITSEPEAFWGQVPGAVA